MSEGQTEKQIEWFVLKGDHRFGPFSYAEVVRMLQSKSVFEFDYVWHNGLPTWQRISDLQNFSPEVMRALIQSGLPGLNEVFFRRRHARIPHGGSLLVHNNKSVCRAKSLEISASGAGLVIGESRFEVGEKLFLHFKPGAGVPPFHARGEIVSKRSVNSSDKNAPVQYGVRFTEVKQPDQHVLNVLINKKIPA